MGFKLFFTIALLCAVQLPESFSKKPNRSPLFNKLLEERDNFGESISLYGLYPALVNHTEYPKIKDCFNTYSSRYSEVVKTFVTNLENTAKSIRKKNDKLPFQRLIRALRTYPTDLGNQINEEQYGLAATLVYNTTAKVIFFDLRTQIVTQKEKKKFIGYFGQENSIPSGIRNDAKDSGQKVMKDLLNCIKNTLVLHLKIPTTDLYVNNDWGNEL